MGTGSTALPCAHPRGNGARTLPVAYEPEKIAQLVEENAREMGCDPTDEDMGQVVEEADGRLPHAGFQIPRPAAHIPDPGSRGWRATGGHDGTIGPHGP